MSARAVTESLGEPALFIQIADLLCGPEDCAPAVGIALLAQLRGRFPHAKRDDVYRAVATAWTYLEAGWLADRLELEDLKRKAHKL